MYSIGVAILIPKKYLLGKRKNGSDASLLKKQNIPKSLVCQRSLQNDVNFVTAQIENII